MSYEQLIRYIFTLYWIQSWFSARKLFAIDTTVVRRYCFYQTRSLSDENGFYLYFPVQITIQIFVLAKCRALFTVLFFLPVSYVRDLHRDVALAFRPHPGARTRVWYFSCDFRHSHPLRSTILYYRFRCLDAIRMRNISIVRVRFSSSSRHQLLSYMPFWLWRLNTTTHYRTVKIPP